MRFGAQAANSSSRSLPAANAADCGTKAARADALEYSVWRSRAPVKSSVENPREGRRKNWRMVKFSDFDERSGTPQADYITTGDKGIKPKYGFCPGRLQIGRHMGGIGS